MRFCMSCLGALSSTFALEFASGHEESCLGANRRGAAYLVDASGGAVEGRRSRSLAIEPRQHRERFLDVLLDPNL